MKKTFMFAGTMLLLLFLAVGCTSKTDNNLANSERISEIDWDNHETRAEQFLMALINDKYDLSAEGFGEDMKNAFSVSELENTWKSVLSVAGTFIDFMQTEYHIKDEYEIYDITTRHENIGIISRIVFDSEGQIAGLNFNYTDLSETDYDKTIIQKDGFIEIPVVIGEETEYPLNGLITIPDNATEKIPAVVLIHGSGAHDMDSTIFENKPFLEIAEYLSSNGIAVIRYNKRNLIHELKLSEQFGGGLTLWEETMEDAILATELIKADPRIDENKVFIIGHSLGGMLAPGIHAAGGDYAGLILLAGSPRPLLEIMADQSLLYFMETMEGDELEEMLSMAHMADEQIDAIVNMSDEEAKTVFLTSGMSAYYLKDNYIHLSSDYIKDIIVPFLIMQGDSDLSVYVDKDFALYQEILDDRANVTFKLYKGLNHLFMPSVVTKITELDEEYKIKANIDRQVLEDITEWIKIN